MISNIHEQIAFQFNKKKLIAYTVHMDLEDIINWSIQVANKNNLDKNVFVKYFKELFWGFTSVQLSLGYGLIALSETEHPSGKKGITAKENEIPDMMLADIHFWYHLHNTWESIYRLWERAVSVLETRLTPNIKRNRYFDGYLNELKNIESFLKQEEILALYKFNKTWGKISEMRNKISHEVTNPFLYSNIEVEFSSILGIRGDPIAKYDYTIPNLKQEIDTVINSYKKSFSLFEAISKVCNCSIKPNFTIK